MANCKSCHAEIIWVKHDITGKPMPLERVTDPIPSTLRGLFVFEHHVDGSTMRKATPDDVRLHRELYRSHFVSCPQAKQWRSEK